MKTRVYEIKDHDVMETFFGDDPKQTPIRDIAQNHGNMIWEGVLTLHPDAGDALVLDAEDDSEQEYVILARAYYADREEAFLLVHARHIETGFVS